MIGALKKEQQGLFNRKIHIEKDILCWLKCCWSFLSSVPDPPVIDLSCCRVYNEGLIHWRLSEDSLPTDHHIVEFRKLGAEDEEEEESRWSASERVYGCSTVLSDLVGDSRYAFRVKSCRNGVFSPCSPEVTFHTPPAPGKTHTRVHVLIIVALLFCCC